MVALYLRGLPRPAEPHPRRWPLVERLLRREPDRPIAALRAAGLALEAAVLEATLAAAGRLHTAGRVLTPLDPHYPRRWPASLAPPALWVEGDPSILSLPGVSVAGSRELPHSYTRFAEAAGAAPTGGCLVSGGAPGADTLAERAATVPVIEILPAGFSAWPSPAAAAVRLSLWPPEAPFSAAAAMERNALIYAFSVITIVCHARFKQGGSWHGAISALRRRLSVLLVPEDSELAHRALVALGARAVPAEALSTAILEPGPALQPLLQ